MKYNAWLVFSPEEDKIITNGNEDKPEYEILIDKDDNEILFLKWADDLMHYLEARYGRSRDFYVRYGIVSEVLTDIKDVRAMLIKCVKPGVVSDEVWEDINNNLQEENLVNKSLGYIDDFIKALELQKPEHVIYCYSD